MLYSYDNYFSISDILSAVTWLIILSAFVFYKSSKLATRRLARLYVWNFYFKVFFGLAFAFYYIFVVNGGDTLGYWEGSKSIQNLLLQDPFKGIEHLLTEPTRLNYYTFFNNELTRPPIWIYNEPESYFISKITAIVGLFTFKSYLATTIIFVAIISHLNWKMFEIMNNSNLFKEKLIAYAALFVPSVAFWCSGISKDTIVLSMIFLSFYALYNLSQQKNENKRKSILLLFISLIIIYETRPVIVMIIVLSSLIYLLNKLSRKIFTSPATKIAFNIGLFVVLIISLSFFTNSDFGQQLIAENKIFKEAVIIQQDFTHNQFYGKNQYSIGEYELTPLGILMAIPISVFSGIFQPLPWNGLSISLFLNAIESAVLLFLLAKIIISGQLIRWLTVLRKNEILVFCLAFVLLLGFIAGFTSIIYGVLVRIRAPLLPMVFALLLIEVKNHINEKN